MSVIKLDNRKNLATGDMLKRHLQNGKKVIMKAKLREWENNGRRGQKPTHLSPLEVAEVLTNHIYFALFDKDVNRDIAMYDAKEGIYVQGLGDIYTLIHYIEPNFNENKAKDVIFHIKNLTRDERIMEKTIDKNLIPVNNGIFNLTTGKLEPFSPEYVFTTKVQTNYVENPTHPTFDDGWSIGGFMKEISDNDEEIEQLLWEVLNECVNGAYTRKKAIFMVGSGNNGKGTFQELITNLVGRNNVAMKKANEFDERFGMSNLVGKSVIIGDDVAPDTYISDSSNFKSVITADPVNIELKHQGIYSEKLITTVIQSTNGMPKFHDKTHGLLRRIIIVPFNAEFSNRNKENFKIKEEYIKNQQVLEYILHKVLNMKPFDRFTIPKASEQALNTYQKDNDPVFEFYKEIVENWETDTIIKPIVYEVYEMFCEDNGYTALGKRKFLRYLYSFMRNEWEDKPKHTSETPVRTTVPYDNYIKKFHLGKYSTWVGDPLIKKPETYRCFVRKQSLYDEQE